MTVAPGRLVGSVFAVGVLAGVVALPVEAQTFQGRVIDDRDERPISTALVRLIDEKGEQQAVSIADSTGLFRLEAPAPGIYRLQAARLGFENLETPLLDAGAVGGLYAIDLLMRAAPLGLPGFTVETNRVSVERTQRQLRLMLGVSPRSMRYQPIDFDDIQDHIARGHNLEDMMRWSGTAGLIVSFTVDGPCFSLRARGCLPVYLNGLRLNRDFMADVPLDMLHTIVVVTTTDGVMQYPGGAVLLYTAAWLG